MNHKMIWYIIGHIFKVEAAFLAVSFVVALLCGNFKILNILGFLIPIAALLAIGFPLTKKKPQNRNFFAKEGFVVVALAWILMSLFGALPFFISREIPNFIDAFFETASGFTTTGSSILTNVSEMSKGLLFWRSLTHWLGGMGVLVFVLAIFPGQETQSIFLMKAESPGPKVGKIVPKLKVTARILYGIYIAMTLVEFIMLLCGGMPLFDSAVNSFATAGTGGFAVTDVIGNGGFVAGSASNAYFEWVIGIFMILFGVNFNVYYLILIRRVRDAFRSEELWVYTGIAASAVALITINLMNMPTRLYATFGETLRHSFFTTASIMSSTGFATVDFELWPTFSKALLVLLMFIGASAGSTGGGIKVARFILMIKNGLAELKRCISPNQVVSVKFEGKPVENDVVRSTNGYLVAFVSILAASTLIVSLDSPFLDFGSSFTGVLACLNNIGPGLGKLGPTQNFAGLGYVSKIVLSFDMIAGRLELFPVLLLLSPKTYRHL